MTNLQKYETLMDKLQNQTITSEEMLLLNLLAYGSEYVESNNKGELVEYNR